MTKKEKETTVNYQSPLKHYECKIYLESFIASPYWIELGDVIDIEKKSGTNRARSEDKKNQALSNYLKMIAMTPEQFAILKAKAARQWHREDDEDQNSNIIIARHQISAMLVHACSSAPSGSKLDPNNLRSIVRVGDFKTNKTKCDQIWKRFVKCDLSNQRRLTSNEVLENFEATGRVSFSTELVKKSAVETLFRHGLFACGVGACRKMGMGRGELLSLELEEQPVAQGVGNTFGDSTS